MILDSSLKEVSSFFTASRIRTAMAGGEGSLISARRLLSSIFIECEPYSQYPSTSEVFGVDTIRLVEEWSERIYSNISLIGIFRTIFKNIKTHPMHLSNPRHQMLKAAVDLHDEAVTMTVI